MKTQSLLHIILAVALSVCRNAVLAVDEVPTEDIVEEQNLRGLQALACKTDADCPSIQCIRAPCPPSKVCMNNKCRNPNIFQKCGSKVCNKKQNQACCSELCSMCGVYDGMKKKLICPKIQCIKPPPKIVPCGKNTCDGNSEYCCNESCGTCSPIDAPSETCNKKLCTPLPVLEQCGPTQCKLGQVCCNESCGYCTAPGEKCTKEICPVIDQEQCGDKQCPTGLVCCNASCGICTKPGQACIMLACQAP